MTMEDKSLPSASEFTDQPDETPRRDVLARIGRFAYVAPAMTLLTDPARAGDYRPAPPPRRPPTRTPFG